MFRDKVVVVEDVQDHNKKFLDIWTTSGMCALDYKRFYDKKLAKKIKKGSPLVVWTYRGGDVVAVQLVTKDKTIDVWYVGN